MEEYLEKDNDKKAEILEKKKEELTELQSNFSVLRKNY